MIGGESFREFLGGNHRGPRGGKLLGPVGGEPRTGARDAGPGGGLVVPVPVWTAVGSALSWVQLMVLPAVRMPPTWMVAWVAVS